MEKRKLVSLLNNYYGLTGNNLFFESFSLDDWNNLFHFFKENDGKKYPESFMEEDLENLSSEELMYLKERLQEETKNKQSLKQKLKILKRKSDKND